MSEPNPYQPPQAPTPNRLKGALKPILGWGIILLLTPVATCVAFCAGCTIGWRHPSGIIGSLVITLPAATLVGMLGLAIWAYRYEKAAAKTGPNRPGWLRDD